MSGTTIEAREKHRIYMRAWRRGHLEECSESNKRWRRANPEKCAAANNAWKLAHPEKVVEGRKNHRNQHPELVALSRRVRRRVRSGALIKPAICSMCGTDKKRIEGHHCDYNKPYELTWLCHACHMFMHRAKKETP